jgi:glycerate-2-kinase/transketolase N-terminal domain/subunit
MLIQNYDKLNTTSERKLLLELIEAGLSSLQPENVLSKNISLNDTILKIQNKEYDLKNYNRIFLIGFGKGAAKNSFLIEQLLGDKLTGGYVIDVIDQTFTKCTFVKGTHPLTSQENVAFTNNVVQNMKSAELKENDLVIVVICGGGSAMFEVPQAVTFEEKLAVDKALLHCGANIKDMNIIRKHLSAVKGGGLAKILYPAAIATLVYSDVPGNDLSTIASGPTVKDPTSMDDVKEVLKKYPELAQVPLPENAFHETPKEDHYFEHVTPFIVLSNLTALQTMKEMAESKGLKANILSDQYQNEANVAAKELVEMTKPGELLLAGGETTVTVHGHGEGGRNQQLVLAALPYVGDDVTIASVGTDGWDNSHNAGGITDKTTIIKAKEKNIDPLPFLEGNDSLTFLELVDDAITTGKLPSNVADVIVVLRKATLPSESKTQPSPHFTIPELYDEKVQELEQKANHIRQLIIDMLLEAGSGHSAGPLGMTDIFTCMYFHILNIDPQHPTDPDRDRLVLSNGHICPVLYATMAAAGFFPEEELKTLRKINSRLQGHPHRGALPGIENTSGPLGEGLSQAIGMALAAKLDKRRYQVYCLMGDGEQNEGNVWESVMTAAKFKLHNLTVIIDRNNIQIDGFTENVMPLESLRAKYEAFGWEVLEIDGHNYRAIVDAVRESNSIYEKPTCIIAHTIPGRGVDFMEEDYTWHGKPPNKEEAAKALSELRTLGGRITGEHQ